MQEQFLHKQYTLPTQLLASQTQQEEDFLRSAPLKTNSLFGEISNLQLLGNLRINTLLLRREEAGIGLPGILMTQTGCL